MFPFIYSLQPLGGPGAGVRTHIKSPIRIRIIYFI